MVNISLDEPSLLFRRWVSFMATGVGVDRVVVVVCPFGKVIGKLEAGYIGGSIFKVNDDQLFVLVCGLKKRRLFVVRLDAQNVTVLCLCDTLSVYCPISAPSHCHLHRCVRIPIFP